MSIVLAKAIGRGATELDKSACSWGTLQFLGSNEVIAINIKQN